MSETLNEVLKRLGYTTRKNSNPVNVGPKDVLKDGEPVLLGATAGGVWGWLRATGQIGGE